MKKLWDLKKVLSNLEVEEQGRGIIMGVTHLLLLGPFMYWNQQTADYSTHHCRGIFLIIKTRVIFAVKGFMKIEIFFLQRGDPYDKSVLLELQWCVE